MSYQSRRMNSILTLSIFVVFANIHPTLALKCYVCGVGSGEPFMQTSKNQLEYSDMDIPSSCDEFDSSNNLDKFIFTCPENYVGCITQSDGNEVTRTCDQLPMNDCKTANEVEYCYCTEDLCNKEKIIPIHMNHDTFYDDEDGSDTDAFESSGYGSSESISYDGAIETTIASTSSTTTPTTPILPTTPLLRTTPTLPTTVTIQSIERFEPPASTATVTTKITTTVLTTTTTTEAITAGRVLTTGRYNHSHNIPSTTAESTNNNDANSGDFVKCSKVMFIMQLLMLIFPLCYYTIN